MEYQICSLNHSKSILVLALYSSFIPRSLHHRHLQYNNHFVLQVVSQWRHGLVLGSFINKYERPGTKLVERWYIQCRSGNEGDVTALIATVFTPLFLDSVAQDISLKSLQSSSVGLQSVHQWVQEAAKDAKRISGGTDRGDLL